jgi:general stress protein 26
MKIQTQASADLTHLGECLKDHRVAMLTMNEAPDGLCSRPMTPLEMDTHGAIWIMTSRAALGPLFAQGAESVNLSFANASSSDYVSVAGKAEQVDDADRKQTLWTAAARPWFSGPDDPDLTLLRIAPRRAEVWDGPSSVVTRVLAMTASVLTGREVGLGHKEVIDTAAAVR